MHRRMSAVSKTVTRRDLRQSFLFNDEVQPLEINQNIKKYKRENQIVQTKIWKKFIKSICPCLKRKREIINDQQANFRKIRDKSYVFDDHDNINNNTQDFLLQLDKKYPTIQPQNRYLLLWQFLVLLFIIYYMIQVPLILFFGFPIYKIARQSLGIQIINVLSIFVLGIDMLVEINVGYYKKGLLVGERRKVIKNYFLLRFWVDIIAVAVLIGSIFIDSFAYTYIKLLLYLKLIDLKLYDDNIQRTLQLRVKTLSAYKLFRVIFIFLIYLHWIACGFFAVDIYYYNQGGTYFNNEQLWLMNSACLPNINMVSVFGWDQWYIWYLYALYWALQTATTVGYGDITPKNPVQVLYTCINIIAMCVMFGYFLNMVWQIIGDLNAAKDLSKKHINSVNKYMHSKDVSTKLKLKIRAYLDYVYRNDRDTALQADIISKLTSNLRQQLLISIYYPFLSLQIFFSQNSNFNKELVYSIQQVRFAENQVIFQKGDTTRQIFYVQEGKVNIGKQVAGIVFKGKHFGQFQFVTNFPRKHSAISQTYTQLLSLDWKSYSSLLSRANEEKLQEIKSEVLYSGKYDILGLNCFICTQSSHLFGQCPQGHYIGEGYKVRQYRRGQRRRYQRNNYRGVVVKQVSKTRTIPKIQQQLKQFQYFYPKHNLKKQML